MSKEVALQAKEAAELKKRKAQKAKVVFAGYFIVLAILLMMSNIIDETSTNISGSVQSNVVNEFFVNGMGLTYAEGLSRLSFMTILTLIIGCIAPFYKTLADKWGRKPLYVLNILGLAVGLSVCFFSTNHIMYIVGYTIVSFFVVHDMQITYVLEASPPDKRARYYGLTKGIGTLGAILLPILRSLFMGNDPSKWRLIYLVPAIIGFVLCIAIVLFARETDTFLNQRIATLQMPVEERKAKKANKTGIGVGFRYVLKHKTLKWMLLAEFITKLATIPLLNYYQSVMHLAGMSTDNITQALYMYPFVYGAIILLCGFAADKFGRKITSITSAIISMVSIVLFVIGSKQLWSPLVVGSLFALYLSTYWQNNDYRNITANEMAPTRIRNSVMGAFGLVTMISMLLGLIITTFCVKIFDLGTFIVAFTIPCIAIGMLVFAFKGTETKGVNLDEIEEIHA